MYFSDNQDDLREIMNLFDALTRRKIPDEVFLFEKKILHITDTPDVIFPYLRRVIRLIEPDIIIHTGDTVDNIKLELSRSRIDIYERRFKEILKICRSVSPEKIIFCLGNHDDEAIINKYLDANKEVLVIGKQSFEIEKLRLCVSHRADVGMLENADYYLFGHNPDVESDLNHKPKILNGLSCIYVIDGYSGTVAMVSYPKDTDYFRQKKFSLGL